MSDSTTAISGTLSDQDRLAVETLYRAFSEHDPALLDTVVSEDWHDLPLATGQPAGRAGTKFLVGGFSAAFPDSKVTVREIIGAPGRAAVRAEITATHLGEWFGVAPTGRAFTLPIHEFHHIDDGRITHTWHMEDWYGWLHQVGALGGSEKA